MLVSIITINYNNALGLERTIKSVISQNYKLIEHIIIDGNSTDTSKDIIQKYQPNLAYSISEKDNGVFDAQNKGIQQAKGDYILVLNSGDELENDKSINTIFLSSPTEDILYGNMMIITENGKREFGKMPKKIDFNHMMNDTLWHPVSFVKKELFNKVGYYNLKYKLIADYDWFLRAILIHKVSLKYYDMSISVFYLGGMSSHSDNTKKLHQERLKSQIDVFGNDVVNEFYLKKNNEKPSIINRIITKIFK